MANVLTRVKRYHAESVATGGLHDPPVFDLLDPGCPQPLETPDFSFEIVGFDIQVHSARVLNRLKLDVGFPLPRIEDNVFRIIRIVGGADFVTQSLAPESCLPVEVVCSAIDDQATQDAVVHMSRLLQNSIPVSAQPGEKHRGPSSVLDIFIAEPLHELGLLDFLELQQIDQNKQRRENDHE